MAPRKRMRYLVLAAPILLAPVAQSASAAADSLAVPLDLPKSALPRSPPVSTAVGLDPAARGMPPDQRGGLSDPRADVLYALPDPDVTSVSPQRPEK